MPEIALNNDLSKVTKNRKGPDAHVQFRVETSTPPAAALKAVQFRGRCDYFAGSVLSWLLNGIE